MNDLDLITAKEARKMFGIVTRWTMYRHIKAGLMPQPVKTLGRSKRFVRSECEAAVRKVMAARDKNGVWK